MPNLTAGATATGLTGVAVAIRVPMPQPRASVDSDGKQRDAGLVRREQVAACWWLRGGARRGEIARVAARAKASERRKRVMQASRFEAFMSRAGGLRWACVGHVRPARGRRLKCKALEAALASGCAFTARQRADFNLGDLRLDSFAECNGSFYRPTDVAAGGVGLSGVQVTDDAPSVHHDIQPRGKRARGGGRPGGKRGATGACAAASTEPGYDRWQRWPVDKVFEVRRVSDGGRRYHVEVRLRWKGVVPQGQPNAGLPWPDEWVRLQDENGRQVVNQTLLKEARELEAVKYGRRAPRRAAPAPPPPPHTRHHRVLRSQTAALAAGGVHDAASAASADGETSSGDTDLSDAESDELESE